MTTGSDGIDQDFSTAMALMVERHRAGDLAGAAAANREALSLRPTHAGARQAGGLIAVARGDYSRTLSLLDPYARRPTAPPEILQAVAVACSALGQNSAAESFLRRLLSIQPENAAARLHLAQDLQTAGDVSGSIGHLRALLILRPADTEALLTYGALIVRSDRIAERRVLDWWCRVAPLDEAAWNLSARFPDTPRRGAFHLTRSLVLAAKDARSAQAQIHMASLVDSRADVAALYRRSTVRFPGDPDVWHVASRYYDGVGELERSIQAAQRASILRPGVLQYDLQAGRAARRAKQRGLAKVLFQRVSRVAEEARSGDGRIGGQARLQLARAAEEDGDYVDAFDYATVGNRLLRLQEPAADRWVAERLDSTRSLISSVPAVRRHLAGRADDDADAPVFLIGFPRSGTTLLEQVLDGHPDIATLEEQPTLAPVLRAVGGRFGSIRAFVEAATEMEAGEMAAAYLTSRASFLSVAGAPLVIDKMPLSTVLVPLILRLFPKARFLFALRHPCDVCLSCFFSDFMLNANMAPFTDFRDTATFYDLVMRLWARCAAELPVDHHVVRYEHVVRDLETEAKTAIGYLGLPWVPGIVDFHHTARAKSRQGRIRTPSYAQVSEPLYSRAAGRWRHYRNQFEAVKPLLLPHVEGFGYRWDDDGRPDRS
ncbi:MAG: sulfotransferase [Thalassobaculaceae bacterium]|nr:sulfotransferase [Thalassobaculaceae bacterium]